MTTKQILHHGYQLQQKPGVKTCKMSDTKHRALGEKPLQNIPKISMNILIDISKTYCLRLVE